MYCIVISRKIEKTIQHYFNRVIPFLLSCGYIYIYNIHELDDKLDRAKQSYTYIYYIYTYQRCCDDDLFQLLRWICTWLSPWCFRGSGSRGASQFSGLSNICGLCVQRYTWDILGIDWGCIWDINVLTYYIYMYIYIL